MLTGEMVIQATEDQDGYTQPYMGKVHLLAEQEGYAELNRMVFEDEDSYSRVICTRHPEKRTSIHQDGYSEVPSAPNDRKRPSVDQDGYSKVPAPSDKKRASLDQNGYSEVPAPNVRERTSFDQFGYSLVTPIAKRSSVDRNGYVRCKFIGP